MLFSCNKWASWRTSIANTLIECALNYDFVREWQRDWFYLWFVDYLGVSSSSFISFQSWRLWTFTNYHWWPLVTLRSLICAATYKANQSRCFFSLSPESKIIINLYFFHFVSLSVRSSNGKCSECVWTETAQTDRWTGRKMAIQNAIHVISLDPFHEI